MQTENNKEKKRSKISAMKIFLWAIFFLAAFFLVLFFAVPAYLSSDSGKNLILGKISGLIDGKIKISSLSMGWFEGVKAQQFDFTDSTGCTKITAKQIAARPQYLALLGGRLAIDEAVIDQPQVLIDISGDCARKKAVTISPAPQKAKADPSAALFAIAHIDLTVNGGNFKITAPDINDVIRTLELKDINTKLAIRPLGSKSSFDISMAVASANEVSKIRASGNIKTGEKEWSLANATGEVSLEVNNLDLSTLSPLFKVFDVNMTTSGRVKAVVDAKLQKGQFENLQGTINASNLDISGTLLKGDRIQTSKFQTDVKLSTTDKTIDIEKLKIEADGLTADIKGTVPKTVRSLEDFL